MMVNDPTVDEPRGPDSVESQPKDMLSAAAGAATELAALLEELVTQAGREGRDAREMAERLKLLEARDRRASEWREGLQTSLDSSLSEADLQELADIADALARKPADLLVLLRISEKANQLAAIVRAHQVIRESMKQADW
jgi:hypothetical protein